MRELESHYRETEEDLRTSGMSECEAAAETARRMGDPKEIAHGIEMVHCQATWKSALLALLPFVLYGLSVGAIMVTESISSVSGGTGSWIDHALYLLFAGCLAMSMAVIALLRSGRRTAWAPTWLAITFSISLLGLGSILGRCIPIDCYEPAGTPKAVLNVLTIQSFQYWYRLALLLGLGYAGYTMYRGSRKTRRVLTALAVVGSLLSAASVPMIGRIGVLVQWGAPWWVEMAWFCISSVLLMAFALAIFGRHGHSNLASVSLFLFTYYALTLPVFGIPSPPFPIHQALFAGGMALSATVVVTSARARTLRSKLLIMGIGLASVVMLRWFDLSEVLRVLGMTGIEAGVGILAYAALVFWVVLVPWLLQRHPEMSAPELVR